MTKRLVSIALIILALGCRLPPPDSVAGRVINCSVEAVQKNWPKALPGVNTCLGSAEDPSWQSCLIALINPTAGITEDVLACVVRDQGARFAASASANQNDVVSARAYGRAEKWAEERGYRFEIP